MEFYDYQKAYDIVRHDWMLRVYRWTVVPEKVVNVISKLMGGWKTSYREWENNKKQSNIYCERVSTG